MFDFDSTSMFLGLHLLDNSKINFWRGIGPGIRQTVWDSSQALPHVSSVTAQLLNFANSQENRDNCILFFTHCCY